ncbi:MAG: hypothetical protein K8R59_03340 [Thermoanaerobaculales bacterium]|nr:hypothetical protein [Thermoanaerobaculales bacterium]
MREFPLLFCFKNVVMGDGYIGGVLMQGRALLVHEEEDLWMMYGVNAGGMAAEGATKEAVMAEFRITHELILNDIATECKTFKAFKAKIEHFFHQVSDEGAWLEAVEEVRRTNEANNWDFSLDADKARWEVRVEKLTQQTAAVRKNPDPREQRLKLAA